MAEMREELIYNILLDLHKAYYALDLVHQLDIIVSYDVGTWALRLLWRYWDCLLIVARAGGYYGAEFKGQRGVTQEDHLSPKIFNVAVDAVLWHWLSVVEEAGGEAGPEGFFRDFHRLAAYFYAKAGLLASTMA